MSLFLTQRRALLVAVLVLILPSVVWTVLLALGYVGSPGNPLDPPFNLSDRIVTIDVAPQEDGQIRATFRSGDTEVKMGAEEFFKEIYSRKRELPWIYRFFDVTSVVGVLWVLFGFAGQAVFTARMLVQWRASEKAKSSVVPPVFWWLSLLGASMLMVYFIWRKDVVGFLGQSTGWFIYIRNLWFIYGKR